MTKPPDHTLPLLPLLAAFRATHTSARVAPAHWLAPAFLDTATDEQLSAVTHSPPRIRFVRHGLNHLVRNTDPLPDRLARCVTPGGAYFVPGLGPGFWSSVVKAMDPERHPLWCPATELGLSRLGLLPPSASRFAAVLKGYEAIRHAAPDLTASDIDQFLERVGRVVGRELPTEPGPMAWQPLPDAAVSDQEPFGGFCTDTFRFLAELERRNTKEWMHAERDRYQFVLREPLIELCEAVAERYVRPILNRDRGWDLECDARPGKALTSICKNDYGRTGPYHSVQWVTFYRRERGSKRGDAQFFVRVAADGVSYGFHLGASAKEAGRVFRANLDRHAEALAELVPLGEFRFWTSDEFDAAVPVRTSGELRAWAGHKAIAVGKCFPPDSPLLRRDELAGEVLLAFDKLVPLFACAAESEPVFVLPPLAALQPPAIDPRPVATPQAAPSFADETLLPDSWLDRVLGLLRLKKQLILQGVPGTGKTHVARHLARLLTDNHADRVRLVQFHPAYSYEEFVEGIRAEATDGGVTYPVVPGVLCSFADLAASRPDETHVLVIDEINRGNLPRIFGELLYLLEYRDEAATLPYSKRPFRLPPNLVLVATMNGADRSAVPLDQAVRRRFSFVEMEPDAAILAAWLERHPPADDTLGPRVVRVFEELNRRLARDAGAERRIGHSFFMLPDLDAAKLAAVWEHHVRPALLDALGGREERLRDYTFANLSGGRARKKTPV